MVRVRVLAFPAIMVAAIFLMRVASSDSATSAVTAMMAVCTVTYLITRYAAGWERPPSMHRIADRPMTAEVDSLRSELAQLRDTTTKFDVSIQHTLERIEHRLDHLEGRVSASAGTVNNGEPVLVQSLNR